MVKRRNSQYAPHDRRVPTRVPVDFTPAVVASRHNTRPRQASNRTSPRLWSMDDPGGGFF
jgi:hypothetical protein